MAQTPRPHCQGPAQIPLRKDRQVEIPSEESTLTTTTHFNIQLQLFQQHSERGEMNTTLHDYLRQIAETTARGDAREESYYPILKSLIEGFERTGKTAVTMLPKKTDAGNPDFRVWDGRQHITGYIEAKIPGANLDQIENSEQLTRYRETFPNLILTDFYEFRLYRDGRMVMKTFIARPFIAGKLKHLPPLENEDAFADLLARFFSFSLPRTFTAESLARELAKRTRFLRDEVVAQELLEATNGRAEIRGFYRAFEKYLLPGLDETQFADLFSQTLTYGMFAARSRSAEDFTRESAYRRIPQTTGVLRDLFRFISLGDLPPQMEVIVDDIADVLSAADLEKILHQFSCEGKGKDPIVHFYETFLSAYDPGLRNQRGVYYTPEPVVGYIVRSIHELLKTRFNLPDGLADPRVTLLDPAAGTLTFPAEAIRLAAVEYTSKYGEGGKRGFIREQILRNYYAFELMMAPYAIGHLKMSYLLEELGCPLEEHDRFQLYLTNSLSMEDIYLADLPGLSALSDESHAALKVKQKPILVILGNPPYSGISANQNEWTEQLLKSDLDGAQSYYTVDGQPLNEKKVWLQDDYVKFLRFAQWKVQKAGEGVVGMITNHGYLDNPTFRGMRQSLMQTFNEIHVLNLHGSSLKKEKTPQGGKDENVFDIRPGVAVVLLVKQKGKSGCVVSGGDLFGTREEKYRWLETHELKDIESNEITPVSPWYFFTKNHIGEISKYQEWPQINTIFPKNVTGIVTARDDFVIDFSKEELKTRIMQFRNPSLSDEIIAKSFKLKDTRGWKLGTARKKLATDDEWDRYFEKILYRPFDVREIYYSQDMIDWGRPEFMRHMLQGENIGLCLAKRVEGNRDWQHAFISDKLITHHSVSMKEVNTLFPLYLYPSTAQGELFGGAFSGREANLMPGLLDQLSAAYGRQVTPEEVLSYIYGVFYSNLYREKYAEALRIDFPRVPFTGSAEVFAQMSALGERLVGLHLLKSAELDPPVARYQGSGNDQIEKAAYDADRGRVVINADKYFEGITPEVWNYQIGGYQVLMKYLKDRKGRRMDDPVRYIQIATALARTITIQHQIDQIYPEVEKDCLPLR